MGPQRAGSLRHWSIAFLGFYLGLPTQGMAQHPIPRDTDSVKPGRFAFLHRHRSGRARPATVDSTLPLQWEMGYVGNLGDTDPIRDQATTLTAVLSPGPRFLAQFDFDSWASQMNRGAPAVHGVGDTRLTIQTTVRNTRPGAPSLGVAFQVKAPTSRPRSLGSGYADLRFLALVSLEAGGASVDGSLGMDANGRAGGLAWGHEEVVSLTFPVSRHWAAHVGWSSATVDTDQPAGRYALASATLQASPTLAFDLGGRLGLSRIAPVLGLSAGFTTAARRPRRAPSAARAGER